MAKQILIDASFGLVRTAISQDGKLLDYYEESLEHGRSKGNIYKGIVKKVDAHIQAAFVRFGSGRDGFLPLRDVPFRSEPQAGDEADPPKSGRKGRGKRSKGAPAPAAAAIGPGDEVLVQVVKDEAGSKGAALTTKLSLSGRYLVYMPGRDEGGGISSRLSDEERAALKQAMADLRIPPGGSVILRTAALGKSAEDLQSDLDRLVEAHREFSEEAYYRKEPGLVYRDAPPAQRYLREYYTPDVDRIWVNREELLAECREFFNLYEPRAGAKVHLSGEGALMFQKLGVEAEVERLSARKVTLPSGANFVIDQAEALVAIDVNSAKSRGDGHGHGGDGEENGDRGERGPSRKHLEEALFAVNMEAGAEIARQLRLRDLGGIIVIDFIDMEEDRHRRKVEELMRRALAADKAKVKVYEISPLGLMQISRQRLRKAGANQSRSACGSCQGRGWHASPAAAATAVLRRIEERLRSRKSPGTLTVTVPFPVSNSLHNEFRAHVLELEQRYGGAIRIFADASAAGDPVFAQGPSGEADSGESRGHRGGEDRSGRDRGAAREDRKPQLQPPGGRGQERGRSGRERPMPRGPDRETDLRHVEVTAGAADAMATPEAPSSGPPPLPIREDGRRDRERDRGRGRKGRSRRGGRGDGPRMEGLDPELHALLPDDGLLAGEPPAYTEEPEHLPEPPADSRDLELPPDFGFDREPDPVAVAAASAIGEAGIEAGGTPPTTPDAGEVPAPAGDRRGRRGRGPRKPQRPASASAEAPARPAPQSRKPNPQPRRTESARGAQAPKAARPQGAGEAAEGGKPKRPRHRSRRGRGKGQGGDSAGG